jgi:hypothetical protein
MRERGVLSFTEWESGAEPNGFFDPDYKGRFAVGCFEHSGRAQPTLPLDPGPPSPPSTPAPAPKPEFGFSDLRIKSTSFEPPSVEFTIRLNLDGGKLLEAWASVGIDNAGKTLEVFAGAIDQGLLEVDGINFANPDPALKAQRVVMRQSASDPFLYECSVRYPKLVLAMSETEFTILAALEKDKKIVKTNASTVRVDLKTGKTQP